MVKKKFTLQTHLSQHWIAINDEKLFTFADTQVIIFEDEDDISYMIRKLDKEYLSLIHI